MPVPMVNLQAQYAPLHQEILAAVEHVLKPHVRLRVSHVIIGQPRTEVLNRVTYIATPLGKSRKLVCQGHLASPRDIERKRPGRGSEFRRVTSSASICAIATTCNQVPDFAREIPRVFAVF